MGKHKNSSQDNIFLNFMRNHTDIARGFVKGDKVVQEKHWKDLCDELNASGPPIKDIANWKKAWIDWKGNIRKKLSHNKAEVSATGGGRFNQYVLSRVEDELAQICNIHKVVNGIKHTESFGTVNVISSADKENLEENNTLTPDIDCLTASPQSSSSLSPRPSSSKRPRNVTDINDFIEEGNKQSSTQSTPRPSTSKRARNLSDISTFIEEENKHFKNIGNMLAEIVKSKEEDRKYFKSIDATISDIRSIKRDETQELKRHHLQIERSLVTKNEVKLQFLELEKLKLDIARNS